MNQPRRRNGEGIARDPRTRGAVVEAHAHRQQHVGLPGGVVGLVMPGARDQSQRQRMIGVDGAEARGRSRHRNLQPLGEFQQFVGGAAIAHALPHDHHRPLGAEQHIDRLDDAFRIGAAAARYIAVPGVRVRRFLGGRFHEHVEGNVEHDRARAARGHGLPGLPDRQRHHLAARRLKHLLAIGPHRGRKVGLIVPIQFLKRAAVELAGRHIAGHRQERHRIEKGIAERDRQVRRARPAGGEGGGRPPRNAVIDVGHEAGDALMVHRDGLEFVCAFVQRVDELDIAVAAQAEHLRHFLLDQIVDNDLGTVERIACRHQITLLLARLFNRPAILSGARETYFS